MPASDREAQSRQQPSGPAAPRPLSTAVSMRDLLASCAAATAVSTPPTEPRGPRTPVPETRRTRTHRPGTHRDAA